MQTNKIQANKEPKYQIQENDAGRYHVEFTKHKMVGKKTVPFTMVQIFSIKDFGAFKTCVEGDGRKRGGTGIFVTGWHETKILHDPIVYLAEKEAAELEAQKQAAKEKAAQVKADAKANVKQ